MLFESAYTHGRLGIYDCKAWNSAVLWGDLDLSSSIASMLTEAPQPGGDRKTGLSSLKLAAVRIRESIRERALGKSCSIQLIPG